jgi:hypothetical protein
MNRSIRSLVSTSVALAAALIAGGTTGRTEETVNLPKPNKAGQTIRVVESADRHRVSVPVVEEVYVSRLLDRDEFRRHCDVYLSREAILSNLE